MSRNQFSDMTPRKRSIRDIPIPNKQTVYEPKQPERIEVKEVEDGYFSQIGNKQTKGSKKWWFIAIVLIGAGFWGASVFLHAATVHIIPEQVAYSGVIDIAAQTDATPTEMQYDSLQFVEAATKKVPATAEENVSIKASGKIMIYNNHSTSPQKLVANTRFESASGKIYRIQEAVTIPGYTLSGGTKVPGSIEAVVYADAGGEAYNSSKTDFTIPGFKGTPQYSGFYARSTTDIIGGFEGKQKKVDSQVLASATEELKGEIASKISESVVSKIPSDFIHLTGGTIIEYTSKPLGSESNEAVITVEATVRAFVFKKEDIDDALKNAVSGFDADRAVAHDYSKLSISNIIESEDRKSLKATLSGKAILYASIEKDSLSKELAGIKKSALGSIMKAHPEILESQVFVRPPWMLSLPKNPERIHIVEKIDE